jgi:hypothetical protein
MVANLVPKQLLLRAQKQYVGHLERTQKGKKLQIPYNKVIFFEEKQG